MLHNASQASRSIELSKQAGFENITIDLIYGLPGLPDERWKQNLQTAFRFNIPHLSCYALTVEPNTALKKMIDVNKKDNIDAETQARHFELLMQLSESAGYEHYEISNFAKPGFRSQHNSSYWQGKSYIGLGLRRILITAMPGNGIFQTMHYISKASARKYYPRNKKR